MSDSAVLERLAIFAKISPPSQISCKICSQLHVRRASQPKRDLAIDYLRSHLGGLEIFHINTVRRGRKFPCKIEVKFSPKKTPAKCTKAI